MKTGLCHGTFDFLHAGHIQHFLEAKKLCDKLVVSFTANSANRRKAHFFYTDEERFEHLSNIKCIDEIHVVNDLDALSIIRKIRPTYYFKGHEYIDPKMDKNGRLEIEKQLVESFGGSLIFTSPKHLSSSTKLIKKNNLQGIEVNLNDETRQLLLDKLDKPNNYKISIIGETIVDRFVTGSHLGISPKSHCSVLSYHSEEEQAGGSMAIARHLSTFVKEINLFTNDYQLNPLPENITINKIASGKIEVTRFQDKRDGNRLFELKRNLISPLNEYSNQFNDDLIILSNFGLGLVTPKILKVLQKKKNKLLVMAQSNSSNHGLNRLDQVVGALAYIGDTREISLQLQIPSERLSELSKEEIGIKLYRILKYSHFIHTDGSNGLTYYRYSNNGLRFYNSSKINIKSIEDTIGCGDAALALFAVSLTLKLEENQENIVPELSNIGGALCTQWLCNQKAVSKQMVLNIL